MSEEFVERLDVKEIHLIPDGPHRFNVIIMLHTPGLSFVPPMNKVVPVDDKHEIRYGINYDTGVVAYGIWYYDEQARSRTRTGLWKGNHTAHRKIGIRKLMPVVINGYAVHMVAADLQELLPVGYVIKTERHDLDLECYIAFDETKLWRLN